MAWQMPQPPQGLADLLKRGGQLPPNPFGATSGAQPAPAMPPPAPDPLRAAVAPPQPAPTPAPPPSDDPAISPVPAPPDLSNSLITDLQKQMSGTSAQIAAVPRPDPKNYKPSIWRRLGAGLAAGAAAYGHAPNAAEIGQNIVNAPWNVAQTDYKRTVSPLQQQLEVERAQLPAAEAAAKVPQNAWENRMKQHEEERQTSTGEGRVEHMRAQNDLANQRAENLDYQLKHPKQSEPKNADEALSAASAAKDPEEKKRLIQLAGDLHRQEIDRVKAARNPKTDDTKGKPNDFNRVGYKKSDAEEDADKAYNKAVAELFKPPTTKPSDMSDEQYRSAQQTYQEGLDAAQSEKNTAYSRAQRDYEQGVDTLGGTSEHVTYDEKGVAHTSKPAQASPAATPQTAADPHDPNFWKSREGKKVTFSDGSVWQYLKGGKPEQIKTPTKK